MMKQIYPGGHSIIKNMGGWLNSLGSGNLVGKRYFGVLKKLIWTIVGVAKMIHMDN